MQNGRYVRGEQDSRLPVDDEGSGNLVVQTLSVRVPQAPQGIEQAQPAEETSYPLKPRPTKRSTPTESVAVEGHRPDLHPPLAESAAVPHRRHPLVDNEERAADQPSARDGEV